MAGGWCRLHYERDRNDVPMDKPLRVTDGAQGCEVGGCRRPHKARGFCDTHYQRLRQQERKARLVDMFGGECCWCGYDEHPAALDFHHRDPGEKSFSVSKSCRWRPWEELVDEARRCDLVCANCHRQEHVEFDMVSMEMGAAG